MAIERLSADTTDFGYARGATALGCVDDMRDPLAMLLGRNVTADGLGDLSAATERARQPLA
jgi:hypothetical protein